MHRARVVENHLMGSTRRPLVRSTQVNDVDYSASLDAERKRASFPAASLTTFLDGGEEMGQFRELIGLRIESDPELCDAVPRVDLSRAEEREIVMRKIRSTVSTWRKQRRGEEGGVSKVSKAGIGIQKTNLSEAFYELFALYDPAWATKMGVHFGLFSSAVVGQATDEQRAYWEPRIATMAVFGCFAMTELGHGSNVKGLETVAEYDIAKQEFVIHSPSITATKWWIGGAGQTATHTVVFARLVINGTDYGVHSFVVQIRSLENGMPCPGVEVGDCGHKFGRNGLDNGWIRFNKVRIPRNNMLMRYATVSPDGAYSPPAVRELTYGPLMMGRVGIVRDCTNVLKKALTIAIRYACIRQQGYVSGSEGAEVTVLDYPTHQHRLFPILAATYCYHFVAQRLRVKFAEMLEQLESNDFHELQGMHAASAGLKAFVTWATVENLEICRQTLGGHGYSAYNGLAPLIGDQAVQVSWEGDNNVLSQQVARYLVKHCALAGARGETVAGFEAYIVSAEMPRGAPKFSGAASFRDGEWQLAAMRECARDYVMEVFAHLNELEKTMGAHEAWMRCQVDLVECARAHTHYYMLHLFAEAVRLAPEDLQRPLRLLRDLHALYTIERHWLPRLVSCDFLERNHVGLLHRTILEIEAELRPEAVALVDAFGLPDVLLGPFGRSDGNVYESYFQMVRSSPGCEERPSWYQDVLKPFLSEGQQMVDSQKSRL